MNESIFELMKETRTLAALVFMKHISCLLMKKNLYIVHDCMSVKVQTYAIYVNKML
jgi:hypothetical protein